MTWRKLKYDSNEEMYAAFRRHLLIALDTEVPIGLVHGRITHIDLKRQLSAVKLFTPEVRVIYHSDLPNDVVLIVELEEE